MTVRVGVPCNTTATVILPCDASQKCEVTRGAEAVKPAENAKANTASYEVGSGLYVFTISAK